MRYHEYEINNDEFWLIEREYPSKKEVDRLHVGPVLSIAWSYDASIDGVQGTLHKHGRPELVDKWFKVTHGKIQKGETYIKDMFGKFGILSFEAKPTTPEALVDINKMLSISGYVGVFLRKYDLISNLLDGEGSAQDQQVQTRRRISGGNSFAP